MDQVAHAASETAKRLNAIPLSLTLLFALCTAVTAGDASAEPAPQKPLRDLYDAYHPWTPPESRSAWDTESEQIRRQVLLAAGLWPMPEKTPLNPIIHGEVDRGDYTVQRVFFASMPGHYVTGSLYRPKTIQGKVPGVLCPHGHWSEGRFYDAGPQAAAAQLESGAETYLSGARFPLQARMVGLVRMGCVVFHYDMIGYADSQVLTHREGFADVDAPLWLHGRLPLQTWNSIRALDFLTSLDDVDAERLAITGASGGGTQTFMLAAVDPRVSAAFPAVMVSTGMQGGCACENADYLRIGINNIAIAALFAPKPMAMSGADDWTIAIETKGLPELKQIYSFFGAQDQVTAKAFPQFKHNYNEHSREMMYNWFNEHLDLNQPSPVKQTDFWPLTREELTVFTEQHPLPDDALDETQLRNQLRIRDRAIFEKLLHGPREDYDRVIGGAAEVMLRPWHGSSSLHWDKQQAETSADKPLVRRGTVEVAARKIPILMVSQGSEAPDSVVLWFDSDGRNHLLGENGMPRSAVQQLLDRGDAVVSADLFFTGSRQPKSNPYAEKLSAKNPGHASRGPQDKYTAMTYGYNPPLLAERVREIVAVASAFPDAKLTLVGTGQAGVWTLLATGLCHDGQIAKSIVDLEGFSFAGLDDVTSENMLPGALKYGGLGGLSGLAFPVPLSISGVTQKNVAELEPLKTLYQAQSSRLQLNDESLNDERVIEAMPKQD